MIATNGQYFGLLCRANSSSGLMATEKQIAANRANAKRSTGPQTKSGRKKSSGNALRHGLSSSSSTSSADIEIIARTLAVDVAHPDIARELAQSELELLQIRRVREEMMAGIFQSCNPLDIKRLLALGRYERHAVARRRRAATMLALRRRL